MPWTSGHQFAAHTADASWKFWRRRARLPCPPRDDLGRPRGARSSCAPAASWESSCLSARHPFCCCITALRFATRLSRHVVREAPVKDDAAIGGCTEVHDTRIQIKNVGSASTRKPVAHRLSCVCVARQAHTRARATNATPHMHGNAERLVLGGVGHENPIDANLLASAFNLINDNLPHTVTPHNSCT